jgi:dUTP pyrophosphatase
MIEIGFKGTEPKRASTGAGGYDLLVGEDVTIVPGHTRLVRTQTALELPNEWLVFMLPRSSMHKIGLQLANQIGLIDEDFRGYILMALRNETDETVTVHKGMSLTQGVFLSTRNSEISFVRKSVLLETARGEGGFGSTDKK